MSLKNYFQFNRREKRGILVLSLILLLIILAPKFVLLFNSTEIENEDEILKEIEEFQNSLVLKEELTKKTTALSDDSEEHVEETKSKVPKISIDPFEVNSSTKKDWLALNFSEKQVDVIMNYLEKAKPINDIAQVKKIYIIDDAKYNEIEPYIYVKKAVDNIKKDEFKEIIYFDLNQIDSLQLLSIGIPGYVANRFLKYRELLGGYYRFDQLNEVYGIKPNHVKLLMNNNIDTTLIDKINVNKADFRTLNKHPYIDYETTKKIFNYLKVMERINSLDELEKNKIISSEQLIKLRPYISFE